MAEPEKTEPELRAAAFKRLLEIATNEAPPDHSLMNPQVNACEVILRYAKQTG